MKNIEIKNACNYSDLDRKINLQDGSIIVQKKESKITGVYLVVPFRDNKNKYENQSTTSYCSLINLDTGQYAFEERCSRATSERRVLHHIEKIEHETDEKIQNMRIQVYSNGNYKISIELRKEVIVRETR